MYSCIKHLLPVGLLIITVAGCSPSKMYTADNENRYSSYRVTDENFAALKQFLQNSSRSTLKDTVIIRYDYKNDDCWRQLDLQSSEYIQSVVNAHNTRAEKFGNERKGVSLFEYREAGNNFSKLKLWDPHVKIDTTGFLFNLLFSKRADCGASAIILPDKRCLIIRSDSHFTAMEIPSDKLLTLLTNRE